MAGLNALKPDETADVAVATEGAAVSGAVVAATGVAALRLGVLQPLFERLDARFVTFLQLPDLVADFREIGVGCGTGIGRHEQRKRECAAHQYRTGHG